MKKLLIVTGSLFLFSVTDAQTCTADNVTTLPGKWIPAMKGDHDHAAADFIKERAILDNIAQIIRSNFSWQPAGGDITTGNAYSIRGLDHRPAPVRKIANTYSNFIFFQHYFCSSGKIFREDFAIRLSVEMNSIPFEFTRSFFMSKTDQYGNPLERDPETETYGYIKEMPVVSNGIINYLKDDQNNNAGAESHSGNSYRILIKEGLLPFIQMSKREYYEKWKILHRKTIDQTEVTKNKMEVLAKTSGDNRDAEMEENHIKQYQGYINKIDAILSSKTAAEMDRPAFAGEEFGEYFEKNPTENPRDYVIKPNLAYYNVNLPKSAPQIISINFRYRYSKKSHLDARQYADEAFYNELERMHIVDLLTEKLKPMLVNQMTLLSAPGN